MLTLKIHPMKIIYSILFCLISQISFSQIYIGLGQTQTTDITIHGDSMYASTYDGLYKTAINPGWINVNWIQCGMQGRHVVQTFVPDYHTFISLVEIDSTGTTQIYKSSD